MQHLRLPATVRASLGLYNTREDIDQLVAGLDDARRRLRMSDRDLDDLYQSVIFDHDRSPRNFRVIEGAHCREAEGHNPLCGDRFKVMLKVEDGVVTDAGFQGPAAPSRRPRRR